MTDFHLRLDRSAGDDQPRVLVIGEVDVLVASRLVGQLLDLLVLDNPATVVVDLSQTTLLTAAGINALLEARRTAVANDQRLRVCGAQGIVRQVLEITGLLHLLEAKADPP